MREAVGAIVLALGIMGCTATAPPELDCRGLPACGSVSLDCHSCYWQTMGTRCYAGADNPVPCQEQRCELPPDGSLWDLCCSGECHRLDAGWDASPADAGPPIDASDGG